MKIKELLAEIGITDDEALGLGVTEELLDTDIVYQENRDEIPMVIGSCRWEPQENRVILEF